MPTQAIKVAPRTTKAAGKCMTSNKKREEAFTSFEGADIDRSERNSAVKALT